MLKSKMTTSVEFTPLFSTFEIVSEDGTTVPTSSFAAEAPAALPSRPGMFSVFSSSRSKTEVSDHASPAVPVHIKPHHVIGKKELSSPSGLALYSTAATSTLALAVGDEKNNRVVALDLHSGTPLTTVEGNKFHSLTYPRGVAVDEPSGTLFVAAFAESKVRAYNVGGEAEGGSGGGPLRSSTGKDEAKLKYPQACTLVGPHLFVSDSDHHRIVQFTAADLAFAGAFGSKGEGVGGFKEPRGLCALPSDDDAVLLVVADHRNDRLVRLRIGSGGAAEWFDTIGSSGSKAGQLHGPSDVAASAHAIYVAEEGNARLQVLSHAGVPMQLISFSSKLKAPPAIRGVCAARGSVCVVTGDKVRVFEERVQGTVTFSRDSLD